MGIKHFLSEAGTGISGVIKQRYSDFIVREVKIAFVVTRQGKLSLAQGRFHGRAQASKVTPRALSVGGGTQ